MHVFIKYVCIRVLCFIRILVALWRDTPAVLCTTRLGSQLTHSKCLQSSNCCITHAACTYVGSADVSITTDVESINQ